MRWWRCDNNNNTSPACCFPLRCFFQQRSVGGAAPLLPPR